MAVYHLEEQPVELYETSEGITVQLMDRRPQKFTHLIFTHDRLVFEQNGQRHEVRILYDGTEVQVSNETGSFLIRVENGEEAFLSKTSDAGSGAYEIRAPMPGVVAEVLKETGTQVKVGDPIIIIETMKLLQKINAPCDGELSAIYFRVGDSIEKYTLLAKFTPKELQE
jgi:biotin carboxyl carrier protein